jgi:excisionase family DNA binding protein
MCLKLTPPTVGDKQADMALLGVRAAASRLGVHENTLRRWEQSGLIHAVKLPTGVRRFREEDVERLYREMHRAVDDAAESERS